MKKTLSRFQGTMTVLSLIELLACAAIMVCIFVFPDFKYYDVISISLCIAFIFLVAIICSSFNIRLKSLTSRNELSAAKIIGNDLNESYIFGQVGILIVDEKKNIIWVNDYLIKMGMELIGHQLTEISEDLDMLASMNEGSTVKIKYENRIYLTKMIHEANLYIFKDITESEIERTVFTEEATIVGYLQIDNYSDLVSSMDETTFTVKTSDLQKILVEYCNSFGMFLRPIRNDTFLMLGNRKSFDNMDKDNFKVVDMIRESFQNTFTISIGFAYGYPGISAMAQEAREALDVALSRGGDQVVVSPYGENLRYIGGKTESKHSENRAKIRVLSQSFTTTIRNSSNVLIIGHYMADFDAIGACIGVYEICQTLKIPAKIIYDPTNVENNAKHAFAKTFSSGQISIMTVNYNDAMKLINPKTLLVVVDINSPDRLLYPNFVKEEDDIKVAIVDHHRPGTSTFKNVVFNGIDSSASSACELVTEYISISKYKIELSPEEATYMMTGTMLDTNYFKNKVSATTFDAMAILKRFGADPLKADEFLKENYEQYAMKAKFISNMEIPVPGIIIASNPDENEVVDRTILALVSQEAMKIAEIDAAFTVGRISETEVGISARSNTTVNVELIMKKMGGGGHFAAAATAIKSTSPSEIIDQLKQVLADYLSSARVEGKNMTSTQTLTNIKPV